jgi:peptidyl-prolyl cis-trans isomerase D
MENKMTSRFQKMTSNIVLTAFIGLICISFMFTGYQSFTSSPDTVADVGPYAIKITEYQQEYNRQLDFYKRIFGGKDLSSKQIESFRIKDVALENLIKRKLYLNFSSMLQLTPAEDQLKKEIKELPYFKTNEQFDITKYKLLLRSNRLTPQQFEDSVKEQIQGRSSQELLESVSLSNHFLDQVKKYKNIEKNIDVYTVNKEALKKHIKVTKTEISQYLQNKDNEGKIKSLFSERKAQLDVLESVKARHILLRTNGKDDSEVMKKISKIKKEVNKRNFPKLAKKYTEDPSGKNSGGDLGEFSRGRMVPAFEKVAFSLKPGQISNPVKTPFGYHLILVEGKKPAINATFDQHKNAITKEQLQKTKAEAHKKLILDVKNSLTNANGNQKKLNKIVANFELKTEKAVKVNRLDGITGNLKLKANQLNELFSPSAKNLYTFEDPLNINIVIVGQKTVDKKESVKVENFDTIKRSLAKILNDQIIESVKKKVKVKIYNLLM